MFFMNTLNRSKLLCTFIWNSFLLSYFVLNLILSAIDLSRFLRCAEASIQIEAIAIIWDYLHAHHCIWACWLWQWIPSSLAFSVYFADNCNAPKLSPCALDQLLMLHYPKLSCANRVSFSLVPLDFSIQFCPQVVYQKYWVPFQNWLQVIILF